MTGHFTYESLNSQSINCLRCWDRWTIAWISLIHFFFPHILHPDKFPFPPLYLLSSPHPHLPVQKRAGLPGIYIVESYNKTRHILSYQGGTSNPIGGKGSPKWAKVSVSSCSHTTIDAEDLVQTHAGSLIVCSVSVSPYQPWLVNSWAMFFWCPWPL